MRCLALAQAWRAAKGRAVFCGAIESASLIARLEADGFECLAPGPGVSATATCLRGRGLAGSWVALDGYNFDADWQQRLTAEGFRVLVIDDEARLPSYPANAILAPRHDISLTQYSAQASTVIMIGGKFRLLRSGFGTRKGELRHPDHRRVILLAFGGADSANVTTRVLLAIASLVEAEDLVIAVLGPLNQHRAAVAEALSKFRCRSELHQDVADIAALYHRSDIAVTAAGGASWEMAACGLPMILIPVAPTQVPSAAFLAKAGAALELSGPQELGSKYFREMFSGLLNDEDRLSAMALAGPRACDGQGAIRVREILATLCGTEPRNGWQIRPARIDDLEAVHRIANDCVVRANSFSPGPIDLQAHSRWFIGRLNSPDCALFVVDVETIVAGLIRFDRVGNGAEIDYAVHPAFRNRGLGRRLLSDGATLAMPRLGIHEVTGVVINDNAASRRTFLAAGYQDIGSQEKLGRDCRVYRLTSQASTI